MYFLEHQVKLIFLPKPKEIILRVQNEMDTDFNRQTLSHLFSGQQAVLAIQNRLTHFIFDSMIVFLPLNIFSQWYIYFNLNLTFLMIFVHFRNYCMLSNSTSRDGVWGFQQ